MKSKIYLEEAVENKDRKFGADPKYYVCEIVQPYGIKSYALFTEEAIYEAINRAATNQEDLPKKSWWERFTDWVKNYGS